MVCRLSLDEYQAFAMRTAGECEDQDQRLLRGVLGLCGEAGELANKVKKMWLHGHDYDENVIIEELGDILWYLAVLTEDLGYGLSTVALRNLDKLHKRYPGGFTHERSRNRESPAPTPATLQTLGRAIDACERMRRRLPQYDVSIDESPVTREQRCRDIGGLPYE